MGNQTDKKFTWVIKNFSSLHPEKIYSDQFVVGGCKWRLLAFPKGNNNDNWFSLYLVVADYNFLPIEWRRHVKVSFTIVNQFSDKLSQLKKPQPCPWLNQESPYWGFKEMITLTELNAKKGFMVNDELKIVVKVEVLEVVGRLEGKRQESSPVIETIDVKGFQVLPSHVESVNRLFKRHQDIASKLRAKNPFMKMAYMNLLLGLTQTMLDWLEIKLDKVKEKKEKEEALKQKCSNLEAQMVKAKAELLAARAPLFLYDDDDDEVPIIFKRMKR
ncbi:hypothetical protein EUTSA_v10011981mg [Eutrema salsugineum]|uniref:MATH domain-containing protein n=1 Tax=Eutrema salsugineum TaxID=72664 RepID=V4JZ57_EUTSA|nr:hypothetical protein EUTSA_v10011981mg [Eutrema salsugineum]